MRLNMLFDSQIIIFLHFHNAENYLILLTPTLMLNNLLLLRKI